MVIICGGLFLFSFLHVPLSGHIRLGAGFSHDNRKAMGGKFKGQEKMWF